MRIVRALLVGCLALSVASCSDEATRPGGLGGPGYTCCDAADLRDYAPGETVQLHWTFVAGADPTAAAPDVELVARLFGPYGSVEEVKESAGGGIATYEAQPLSPTGASDLVSRIVLPDTARAGWYNLELVVLGADGIVTSSASIIRVTAAA